MESNHDPAEAHGAFDAAVQQLDSLRTDRANLAERLQSPRWLAPGFGLVAAAYTAIPSFADDQGRRAAFIAALVASIALVSGYRRATGIKLTRVGVRARTLAALAVLASLVLLSVSYGLAAAGLHWWIALSAAAGFALVSRLAAMFTAAARDRLRHGR
jgi:hypothetical protein